MLEIDPRYFRPTEAESLLANPRKAKKNLGWQVKVTFDDLVKIMMDADMRKLNLKVVGEGDKILREKFTAKWWSGD